MRVFLGCLQKKKCSFHHSSEIYVQNSPLRFISRIGKSRDLKFGMYVSVRCHQEKRLLSTQLLPENLLQNKSL